MITRVQLAVLLGVAAAIWGVLLLLDGVAVSLSWLRPFSGVLGAVVLVLLLFDGWGWRFRFLHPWFVSTPNVRGTWKGEVTSTWNNANPEQSNGPIEAYLVIRQTFSMISIRLITKESSSELLAGSIVRCNDGTYEVAGTYRNTPKLLVRERSPIHHGGLLLRVQGDPPASLEGEYWTDRATKGELRFKARSGKLFDGFESASAGPYSSGEESREA